MSRTAIDTSVVIAGLMSWHDAHGPALAALRGLLASQEPPVLPVPVLTEAYSVMTRLPPPRRMSPQVAAAALAGTFRGRVREVGLSGSEAWDLIDGLADGGTAGGSTYDAAIIACARKGGASRILTLNRADFERLAPAGLAVVVP